LIASCVDLFLAGTETSSGLLSMTMRYMLWHPEIQDKVRQEIYKVVGKERSASADDINECVIHGH
jgi:cytochrome P450